MKQLFSAVCLFSLIIPGTFFSMDSQKLDFDKEHGIPLETIYNNVTGMPSVLPSPVLTIPRLLEKQFDAFERKMLDEFGGLGQPIKKRLNVDIYFERIQTDIPKIITNPETIKKYALVEGTFFFNAIHTLKKDALDNYSNVTSDTLAIIDNPNAQQPCTILNSLQPALKAFVMDDAYRAIDAPAYKCIEFPQGYRNMDFHPTVHLAAITHNDTFQIWDLQTGESYIFPKKASMGWLKFSDNGKQLITAMLHKEEPPIIHIDIWDSITKKLIHTIEHPGLIWDCILHNKDTKQILFIFNKDHLFRYTIKKDRPPVLSEKILTMIKEFYSGYNRKGDYELSSYALFKKCIPYFLCSKAIQNTTDKNSLQTVRIAPIYQQLTFLEKNLIEKEIVQKTEKLIQNENGYNTRKFWFG